MKQQRHYNLLDRLVMDVDRAVQTVFGTPVGTARPDPADEIAEATLTEPERTLSEGLMRVNHAGEVAAQALYQGQAAVARTDAVRKAMKKASDEENDHLAWCAGRLQQLSGHTSYLGPLWYAGSFAIGALAGLAGDKWSLGFVAETEHQVIRHLDGHLEQLPEADGKSRAILEQMREDEAHHATVALESGAAALPGGIRKLMKLMSRVMTETAYRL